MTKIRCLVSLARVYLTLFIQQLSIAPGCADFLLRNLESLPFPDVVFLSTSLLATREPKPYSPTDRNLVIPEVLTIDCPVGLVKSYLQSFSYSCQTTQTLSIGVKWEKEEMGV